jgi:hypothetical protein
VAFQLPSGFYDPTKWDYLPAFIRDNSGSAQVSMGFGGLVTPLGGATGQEFVINNLKFKP